MFFAERRGSFPRLRRNTERQKVCNEKDCEMWNRRLHWPAAVMLAVIVCYLTAERAWAIGFYLRETKDELKLKYDVTVNDHKSGRVTVVFTLADEGRLKPLDEVQLVIPAQKKNEDGSNWMDLVVSIDMVKSDSGKRVGRVHLLKELAERAEIQLNTHTMDGNMDGLTRLHHPIPISKYMNNFGNVDTPAAAERKEN
jgi:hypothetical protein